VNVVLCSLYVTEMLCIIYYAVYIAVCANARVNETEKHEILLWNFFQCHLTVCVYVRSVLVE